ncbi:MAG: hypothetical protein ACOVRG_02770 [Saprospiraceae bacterium]|jgi:hypothetical protein
MNRVVLFCILSCCSISNLYSQLSLSIQGSIQNSSGVALPDGQYELIFNIYDVATGGQAVWTEIQPQVEIIGGLYSSILGLITPLTASSTAFNFTKPYYLGVTLKGKQEISPRSELSASAYSLSVSGKSNELPSQGSVGIGTLNPSSESQLHVQKTNGTARILVEGRDTARLKFKADADSASISFYGGKVYISNYNIIFDEGINLANGKTVSYNGDSDWRLIEYDDFNTNEEGWYSAKNWQDNEARSIQRISLNTPFSKGFMIRQNSDADGSNAPVLKKEFNLTGIPHSKVKVVFTYHFFDSWDYRNGRDEFAFGAFYLPGSGPNSTNGIFQVGWRAPGKEVKFEGGDGSRRDPYIYSDAFNDHFNGAGYNNIGSSDFNLTGSMTAEGTLGKFWVVFGSNLDQGVSDESYAISNIEIWVK